MTNLFEYVAGLAPNNPNSRFSIRVQAVPGQPGQKNVIFSPRFADRTYVVKWTADLASGVWNDLTSSSLSDNVPLQERTVTDLSASGAKRFYRIEITKP